MKICVYHADNQQAGHTGDHELYPILADIFLQRAEQLGYRVTHIGTPGTVNRGHEFFEVDAERPDLIIYNRELAWRDYVAQLDGAAALMEWDQWIAHPIPELETDAALLWRNDDQVNIGGCWRASTRAALPLWQYICDTMAGMDDELKRWHGDSAAFQTLAGQGIDGHGRYMVDDMSVEFRNYYHYNARPRPEDYAKLPFDAPDKRKYIVYHYKGDNKESLIEAHGRFVNIRLAHAYDHA